MYIVLYILYYAYCSIYDSMYIVLYILYYVYCTMCKYILHLKFANNGTAKLLLLVYVGVVSSTLYREMSTKSIRKKD